MENSHFTKLTHKGTKKNGYTQIKVQKNKNIFPFMCAVCAL